LQTNIEHAKTELEYFWEFQILGIRLTALEELLKNVIAGGNQCRMQDFLFSDVY